MNAPAQDKLVAIDVLLEPDQRMLTAADEWNKRLRDQMPEGFSLDETHRPHITLLQQYVTAKDLDAVVAVVKSLAATANLEEMKLTAKGLYHIPGGKIGLQGITIKPSDEILALQTKVIQAMAPFRKSGGDQAAFVPDPTGTPFDPMLFKYVDSFVEKQAGKNYNPHVNRPNLGCFAVASHPRATRSKSSSVMPAWVANTNSNTACLPSRKRVL